MMTTPEVAARNFWATITGIALQMVARGTTRSVEKSTQAGARRTQPGRPAKRARKSRPQKVSTSKGPTMEISSADHERHATCAAKILRPMK